MKDAAEALTTERRPALRATALGVILRRLRRRDGETLPQMARRIGPFDRKLSAEALAALERGDAAPPPGFDDWLRAAYPFSAAERAELNDAYFLAADPFRAATAGSGDARAHALAALAQPLDPEREDALERARALLTHSKTRLAPRRRNSA